MSKARHRHGRDLAVDGFGQDIRVVAKRRGAAASIAMVQALGRDSLALR
jgi:hypothetical protein